MPILFVHGVAIREGDDPEWNTLHRLTKGVNWPDIQQQLQQWVAPAISEHPEQVAISQVYWGDLGARYRMGGRFHSLRPHSPLEEEAEQAVGSLAHELEGEMLRGLPVGQWPAAIAAVAEVMRDPALLQLAEQLPAAERLPMLNAAARTRLKLPAEGQEPLGPGRSSLRERLRAGFQELPELGLPLRVQRRQNLSRTLGRIRRPIEDFVPIFIGDVLAYLVTRGTPEHPGPIMRRVLDALQQAHAAAQASGEKLIVLTHSMGGLLMYDALSAFLPTDPALSEVRVDFWCAAGGQVGLFKELGFSLDEELEVPQHALPAYDAFWNVWSYSDLFSFRADGIVPGAQDTSFPLTGNVQAAHLAYLSHPDFYAVLAAKVRAMTPPYTGLN